MPQSTPAHSFLLSRWFIFRISDN